MTPSVRQRCRQRLDRLHVAARRRLLVHGLVAWVAAAGGLGLVLVAVLGAFGAAPWVRLGLVSAALALVVAAGVDLLLRPWLALRSRAAVARRLDRAGDYHDTLAAADEVLRLPDRWRTDTPVRTALVERLLARTARLLDDLPLPRLLPVARPLLVFGLFVVVMAGWVGTVRVAPDTIARGTRQLLAPWRSFDAAPRGGLRLAPGVDHVIAGEDLALAALDLASDREPLVLEVRSGSQPWRRTAAREVPVVDADPVLGAPYRRWEATLSDVRDDLVYRFRAGGRVTDERAVVVWRPPLLAELAARVMPPAYTGLPVQDLAQLPAYLEAPVGSRLELRGRSSRPLQTAALLDAGGDTTALAVRADTLAGVLALDRSRRFSVALRDGRGLVGRSELVYEVGVIPDRVPTARLQRPDDDGRLPLTATLRLLAAAEDDHGVAGVDLLVRRGDADGGAWVADLPGTGGRADDDGWERIALDGDGARRVDAETSLGTLPITITPRGATGGVRLDLDLQPGGLALVPGDVLELVLEARDNREPGPAGVGRSEVLRLQVPSSLELLRARDESETGHRGDLAEMRRRAESLGADLERLRRELLKDPSPDWDRRQELQAAVERQQELQAELSRLSEALQQDLERLAESRLTSPEIAEKMDRIAELMADAQTGGMQELLEKLRESLEQMSARDLSMSMEDLERSQTEMLRRLDTAMSMLDDLAREQEMEGLTDLLAEMISKQQELADAGREAAQEQDADELARRQEALSQEMEALEERFQDALDGLQDSEDGDPTAAEQEMREALEQALEQLSQQETSETMKKAGENLQQQLSQEAAEQMQQALTDLAGLYHVMLRSQMAMQMAMQQQQAGRMRDLAADLLTLSHRQESLELDLPVSLRDVRADDLVRRQNLILQGTMTVRDDLGDVAGAAPREILRLLEKLDELLVAQGRVLDQLEEGRADRARPAAEASLAGINGAVIELLTQAQMTGQGGGAGMPQPMLSQQLRQMAEEQSGLNALAEQMRRKQGRMSQELRAGMKRLQQGQQGLAGSARELAEQEDARTPGEGERLLGDLHALSRDMERVGDDLAGGLVTEETMRRQERILSRLLDMHNASRERDWARRRESRAADEIYAGQEGADRADPGTLRPEARRWRPVEEAPPAYRDLVRDYFREIQRMHESLGRDREGRRAGRGGRP